MKSLSIYIMNPTSYALVRPAEWAKTENPESAEFVAIIRENGTGFLLAKDPVADATGYEVERYQAIVMADNYKSNEECAAMGVDNFRLPSRIETIEIYNAVHRHHLNNAIKSIGGTPLDTGGEGTAIWTEDIDGNPKWSDRASFVTNIGTGDISIVMNDDQYAVRPVADITVITDRRLERAADAMFDIHDVVVLERFIMQEVRDFFSKNYIGDAPLNRDSILLSKFAENFTKLGRRIERTILGAQIKQMQDLIDGRVEWNETGTEGVDTLIRDRAIWGCIQFVVVQEQQQDVATALVFDAGWTKEKMRSLQKDSGRYDEEMNAFIDSL